MKLLTALAIVTVCTTLNAQLVLIPGQSVLLGDVYGSTIGGAHIQYDSGLVTVSLGENANPHPFYWGVGWIAHVGPNNHLILPLNQVGSAWEGTFAIPQALPLFSFDLAPSSYFLVITYGGFATFDVNDTVLMYRSETFAFGETPPIVPDPVIPPEDPVIYPPNPPNPPNPVVPEPGTWALLSALGLLAFASYRRMS